MKIIITEQQLGSVLDSMLDDAFKLTVDKIFPRGK